MMWLECQLLGAVMVVAAMSVPSTASPSPPPLPAAAPLSRIRRNSTPHCIGEHFYGPKDTKPAGKYKFGEILEYVVTRDSCLDMCVFLKREICGGFWFNPKQERCQLYGQHDDTAFKTSSLAGSEYYNIDTVKCPPSSARLLPTYWNSKPSATTTTTSTTTTMTVLAPPLHTSPTSYSSTAFPTTISTSFFSSTSSNPPTTQTSTPSYTPSLEAVSGSNTSFGFYVDREKLRQTEMLTHGMQLTSSTFVDGENDDTVNMLEQQIERLNSQLLAVGIFAGLMFAVSLSLFYYYKKSIKNRGRRSPKDGFSYSGDDTVTGFYNQMRGLTSEHSEDLEWDTRTMGFDSGTVWGTGTEGTVWDTRTEVVNDTYTQVGADPHAQGIISEYVTTDEVVYNGTTAMDNVCHNAQQQQQPPQDVYSSSANLQRHHVPPSCTPPPSPSPSPSPSNDSRRVYFDGGENEYGLFAGCRDKGRERLGQYMDYPQLGNSPDVTEVVGDSSTTNDPPGVLQSTEYDNISDGKSSVASPHRTYEIIDGGLSHVNDDARLARRMSTSTML